MITLLYLDQALRSHDWAVTGVSFSTLGEANVTGRADGVLLKIDFTPEATQQQITAAIAFATTFDLRERRVRPVWDIFMALLALTTTQQDAVIADLGANSFAKVKALRPPQDGPALALHWAATSLNGASASEKRNAGARIAAMYAQQNVTAFVNPAYDPTINIPGDEPVP